MNDLPYIPTSDAFKSELKRLHQQRKAGKTHQKRTVSLSKSSRQQILDKTGGQCHVCGRALTVDAFEADHVKSHSSGGSSIVDNYLPACRMCNNYRWHYLADELRWILKLGVWARTEIAKGTAVGDQMNKQFIAHENRREKRRLTPRSAIGDE